MGLFDRFKKNKEKENPFKHIEGVQVEPMFFGKPDGSMYGSITINEGEITVLPRDPWALWKYNGKRIEEWQLCLMGTTIKGIIKDMDYRDAFFKLMDYRVAEGSYNITVRGLTYEEMENL